MKNKFLALCNRVQVHWLALVIFLTILWSIMLLLIAISWLYGFWSNGLWGTKFELMAGSTAIGVVLGGFASIAALAKAGWTKYQIDSEKNSPQNEMPYK